jgi:hypothetical protein
MYLLLPKQLDPCPFISTREKQQLPTPHRHHSRTEMDNMPGRSTWHQPSSLLLGLPQDLRIEIAACVGATSERPLAELRSLRDGSTTLSRWLSCCPNMNCSYFYDFLGAVLWALINQGSKFHSKTNCDRPTHQRQQPI